MEKIIAYILLLAVVGIIIFNLNLPNKNKKHIKTAKWEALSKRSLLDKSNKGEIKTLYLYSLYLF